MKDFATLIESWPRPSIRSFADDIGVQYVHAQVMKHRNSIPAEYWDLVVIAAEARGMSGVTLEVLQQMAAKRRGRKPVGNASVAA